jgi:vacuolar iron transporter family protein
MADALNTTAAHLDAVRKRGRRLMASEAEGGVSYELLHATSAVRDGTILLLILWVILLAVGAGGHEQRSGLVVGGAGIAIMFAAAIVFAVYAGVANMLAIAAQLRFWESELRREREEIRNEPGREREEVRALYEAKGFSGRVLDEIVDTLCADEDRLLKVMMEEELGIFFEQVSHPVVIGVLTGAASLAGGLAVATAAALGPPWLALSVAGVLLAAVSGIRVGWRWRATMESAARWVLTACGVAGLAYFLAMLLVGA